MADSNLSLHDECKQFYEHCLKGQTNRLEIYNFIEKQTGLNEKKVQLFYSDFESYFGGYLLIEMGEIAKSIQHHSGILDAENYRAKAERTVEHYFRMGEKNLFGDSLAVLRGGLGGLFLVTDVFAEIMQPQKQDYLESLSLYEFYNYCEDNGLTESEIRECIRNLTSNFDPKELRTTYKTISQWHSHRLNRDVRIRYKEQHGGPGSMPVGQIIEDYLDTLDRDLLDRIGVQVDYSNLYPVLVMLRELIENNRNTDTPIASEENPPVAPEDLNESGITSKKKRDTLSYLFHELKLHSAINPKMPGEKLGEIIHQLTGYSSVTTSRKPTNLTEQVKAELRDLLKTISDGIK